VNIFTKIKNSILDFIGDLLGTAMVLIDHDWASKDYKGYAERIKGYDNILDAIADGKFGYSQDYENLLRKYGRTFNGNKTNKQSDQGESNTFKRTKSNAWMYDSINESLRKQAEFVDDYEKKPKSFKEIVQEAEFVEAEVIDL